MARVRMPQMAEKASGSFGENIVYASWKGKPYSRIHATPHNPKTVKQVAQRTLFREAVEAFKKLTDEQKKAYTDAGAAEGITGLNFFLREYMKAKREGLETPSLPKAA